MKKLFKVLLITFISLNAITVMSFLAYTPEDYCQRAEISEKLYLEYSKKLGMTYDEYMSLPESRRFKLYEVDKDYLMLKPSYESIEESAVKCIEYIDVSKWSRFVIDVQSGEYFN